MSRSRYYVGKREPKNKSDLKGYVPFCGLTCCSPFGKAPGKGIRPEIRAIRRAETKRAIKEGLQDLN